MPITPLPGGRKVARRVSNPPLIAATTSAAAPVGEPSPERAAPEPSLGPASAPGLDEFRQQRAENLDALGAALSLAEQAINEQELRVAGSVLLWQEDDDGHTVRHFLEYFRQAEGWGLYVTTFYDEEDDPHSIVRLAKAPRAFRLRAVDVLDELWADLIRSARAEDQRVRTQAERAAAFVARISGRQVP